jgi:hypothetical protein
LSASRGTVIPTASLVTAIALEVSSSASLD